jgi:hypothetical protein
MCHTRRIQGFLPHADLSSYKRLFQKWAGMSKLEGCRIHPAEEWQGVCRNEHCLNFIWLFISFQVGIQEPARLDIVGLQAVEAVVKAARWHTPCSFLFPRFGVMERGILEVSSRQYSVSQKFSYIVDSNILLLNIYCSLQCQCPRMSRILTDLQQNVSLDSDSPSSLPPSSSHNIATDPAPSSKT